MRLSDLIKKHSQSEIYKDVVSSPSPFERFPDVEAQPLRSLGGQSIYLHGMEISGGIRYEACDSGLRLSPGFSARMTAFPRPLFVPWREISVSYSTSLGMPTVAVDMGSPPLARGQMDRREWRKLAQVSRRAEIIPAPVPYSIKEVLGWLAFLPFLAAFFALIRLILGKSAFEYASIIGWLLVLVSCIQAKRYWQQA